MFTLWRKYGLSSPTRESDYHDLVCVYLESHPERLGALSYPDGMIRYYEVLAEAEKWKAGLQKDR